MKIVLMGLKGAGKSSVGKVLSEYTGLPTVDTDRLIEDLHAEQDHHRLGCREVLAEHGEAVFRRYEREAAERAGAIPVVENMAALTVLDAWEIRNRLRPGWDAEHPRPV